MRQFILRYLIPRFLQFLTIIFIGITVTFIIPRLSPTDPVEAQIAMMTARGNTLDAQSVIYWNGDVVANKPELEAKMIDAAARPVQPEVHLRPNKLAEYKDVAGVMASAQRLGLVKLGLVGNEQFVK